MAPTDGVMNRIIRESASTEILLTLIENGQTIFRQRVSLPVLKNPASFVDIPIKNKDKSADITSADFAIMELS